jgi:hypothetical protein
VLPVLLLAVISLLLLNYEVVVVLANTGLTKVLEEPIMAAATAIITAIDVIVFIFLKYIIKFNILYNLKQYTLLI